MKSFVYITTNLINGKKYLGKHNGKHDGYLGSGTVLKDAIKKYGKENFEREIVKEGLTDEEAYELEKQLSETWNVVSDPNWYNMRIGGEGFQSGELHPMFGIPKSDEHKQKLSLVNQGKIQLDTTKEKIRQSKTGDKNPMYGKKNNNHPAYGHTKTIEGRKNISQAQKDRVRSPEEIEKIKKSKIGKGIGDKNVMANPENRKKVSLSKIGKRRHYREDGSFYMAYKN
jgi:hypothetical protein